MFCCAGCKKEYTCRCTTTFTYTYTQESYTSKSDRLPKLTEKQAKAVCEREEEDITETFSNLYTNNGNWVSGTKISTNCYISH